MDLKFLFVELSTTELQAILLSLKVGFFAVIFMLPLSLWLAYILARKNFIGKSIIDSIIHLPLVLPPVVIGYLLLLALNRNSFLGNFLAEKLGIELAFNWYGAVVASAVMALPLMVRVIRQNLEAQDLALEQAALTLRASRCKILLTLVLPQSLPAILNACVLAFARSLGEFGATITFAANIQGKTQTIPLALYSLIETPNSELLAFRLCVLAIIISLSSLWFADFISKKATVKIGKN